MTSTDTTAHASGTFCQWPAGLCRFHDAPAPAAITGICRIHDNDMHDGTCSMCEDGGA